jgi:hypothetical protein
MGRFLGCFAVALASATLVALGACSSDNGSAGAAPVDEDAGAPIDASTEPLPEKDPFAPGDAAACNVRFSTETIVPSNHVPEGTAITYAANPPTSGPHYPSWANFQEFDRPVPYPYLVHSMEHGALVLLYKCTGPDAAPECATRVETLRAVRRTMAADLTCDLTTSVRVVIAPNPDLDAPLVIAAWGVTYRADCLERRSITDFAKSHYDQAPESSCVLGVTTF